MRRRRNELPVEAMNADQLECFRVLCDVFMGAHHVPPVRECSRYGISTATFKELATFDYDSLTRLVFSAHDRAVRVAVRSSAPRYVEIALWKRQREGDFSERHPTIEAALAKWREYPHRQWVDLPCPSCKRAVGSAPHLCTSAEPPYTGLDDGPTISNERMRQEEGNRG